MFMNRLYKAKYGVGCCKRWIFIDLQKTRLKVHCEIKSNQPFVVFDYQTLILNVNAKIKSENSYVWKANHIAANSTKIPTARIPTYWPLELRNGWLKTVISKYHGLDESHDWKLLKRLRPNIRYQSRVPVIMFVMETFLSNKSVCIPTKCGQNNEIRIRNCVCALISHWW